MFCSVQKSRRVALCCRCYRARRDDTEDEPPAGDKCESGTVELWFSREAPYRLCGIFWEAGDKGELRLTPDCRVLDWGLKPGMTREMVTAWLSGHGLSFEERVVAGFERLQLPAGISISWDEAGSLNAISAG